MKIETVLLWTLHWRHNDHDGVSNHQPHGCLLNRLFRRRSKKTSKLRVTGLCVGNSPGPVNSPHKGPVTRKMFPFNDVIMSRPRPMNYPWVHHDMGTISALLAMYKVNQPVTVGLSSNRCGIQLADDLAVLWVYQFSARGIEYFIYHCMAMEYVFLALVIIQPGLQILAWVSRILSFRLGKWTCFQIYIVHCQSGTANREVSPFSKLPIT